MILPLLKASALALAATLLLVNPASASVLTLDFDAVVSGADANTAAPAGITFANAVFIPDLDAFGDPIPGSEKWQVDSGAPSVTVLDPASVGYGPAPSSLNALDARFQSMLLQFATPINLSGFSITLDNSTFGDLFPAQLLFLDASRAILAQIALDQTIPGLIAGSNVLSLPGVQSLLLPSGAFFDNISITAVPAPATLLLLFPGLLGLAWQRRRIAR